MRVRTVGPGETRSATGKHQLALGSSLTLGDTAAAPTALAAFLASVASDLLTSIQNAARRARVEIDHLEALITAELGNPLVALGVMGEEGSPRVTRAQIQLYVTMPDSDLFQALLEEAQRRAPVYATLAHAGVELQVSVRHF